MVSGKNMRCAWRLRMHILSLKYSSICEQGLVRKNNQDSVYVNVKGHNGVFCVADGMGGYEKGEVASGIIVDRIKNAWETIITQKGSRHFRNVFNAVSNAIKEANREIYENYNNGSVCGSTVTVLLLYKKEYGIISSGDSRLYSCFKGKVRQMTVDDVWENLPAQKNTPFDELRKSPKFGKLTNAVGTTRDVRLNCITGRIRGSGAYMLCSDGAYKMCGYDEFNGVIREFATKPDVLTEAIRQKVFMAGARDNLSVIALYIRAVGLFGRKDTETADNRKTDDITDVL